MDYVLCILGVIQKDARSFDKSDCSSKDFAPRRRAGSVDVGE